MRILLINPPHRERVQRRYRCSYRAPRFLFPPLELMTTASALNKQGGHTVRLVDAIALDWDVMRCAAETRLFKPDLIVSMPGFEILDDDLAALAQIRNAWPEAKLTLFGYLAGMFPERMAELAHADHIVVGEPELAIVKLARRLESGGASLIVEEPVENLDSLPAPDYSLAPLDRYSDFMFPKPFAALQTSRGCPYGCSYCVRPYGRKMIFRSVDAVIADVSALVEKHGVRGIRFEDDTFTVNKGRVLDIAKGLAPFGIAWSCLSHPDNMDDDIAKALAKGGCKRVYLGIESASDAVLKTLGRSHTAEQGLKAALAIKNAGVEVAGFFLVGAPGETEADFQANIELAKKAELDFLGVSTLVPYPGTALFDRGDVTFELSPFVSRFRDDALVETGRRREKEFYRRFYFDPAFVSRKAVAAIMSPIESLKAVYDLSRHLLFSRGEGKHGDLI